MGEFDRWITNCELVRFYTTIFMTSSCMELREVICDVVGDMGRVHMRFLRSKHNYRVYMENIYYSIYHMILSVGKIERVEDRLRVALRIGANLKKLTIPGIIPIFFDITRNISEALIYEIKTFITDQVMG